MASLVIVAGIIFILGAFTAWQTGETVRLSNGASWHTHADAAWVLGVLGLAMLTCGGIYAGVDTNRP